MTHLDEKFLSRTNRKLKDEMRRINENIKELRLQDPFNDPDRVNDNASTDTDANEEERHDRVEAQIKELERKLNLVSKALENIKKGSFGHCARCGREINLKRLEVIPYALYCLTCEKQK